MEVVKAVDEQNQVQEQEQNSGLREKSPVIRMKRPYFIMLLVFLVIFASGITAFALSFGKESQPMVIGGSSERDEFAKLYNAYDTLKKGYYKDIDEDKVINGAINGMIQSLDDPYSTYMDEKDAKEFQHSVSSSFEGIGAEIQEKDGHIMIVSPLKGSPAEKAGLKPKDIVIMVDGKSIQGMTSTQAVMLIRGEKGTKVELTIQRPGVEGTIKVPIIRDEIPIETVHGEMVGDGIAKVQITTFSTNTSKELVETLNNLQEKGMKGLILDLRQNPGGLLEQAVSISSMFVPKGKLLFKVEERNGNIEEYKSKNEGNPEFPLVVLIDNGSASASEILAGAVKESAGVPLVGEKSFGKGTVQTVQDFPDGSNVKFTTAKWLTPNGNWIHKKGIEPDYKVAVPDYYNLPYLDPKLELKKGSSSNDVKTAQQMLSVLGFDPGRKDGFFDEKTENAVKAFQQANKLQTNGAITGSTTEKIIGQLQEKIIKDDPQLKKAIEVIKKEMK
ncbi:peptidase S41 [Neobacillus piezotolerans]|uniref:C-terminal processing peptidase n=1 Tax=Neobacillus piezotolerans TaxID=2259171 RepID=A0A3D8GQ94_9BACI|nr:S41 family peptidase [Neobacillus piezotolerans]RDU36451.1 peptidase S41 [Neobacillus piezotolerans]